MAWVADTNILLYWIQPAIPERAVCVSAVQNLQARGERVVVLSQNVAELWYKLTRPTTAPKPGLGMTVAQADAELSNLERLFPVVREHPVLYDEWRQLIVSCNVSGVQVYDARIAAGMRVYGLMDLLTFNTGDFARYPGITAWHPRDV